MPSVPSPFKPRKKNTSSALAARLGAGETLDEALVWATEWLHEAIENADALHVGRGRGPVDHGHRLRRLAAGAQR